MGVSNIPQILHLPQSTAIGYTPFLNTALKSIYLPNLVNTNGLDGISVPKIGRGDTTFRVANEGNMKIFYTKNLSKINGWFFGGELFAAIYSHDIDPEDYWYNKNYEVIGRHIVNG